MTVFFFSVICSFYLSLVSEGVLHSKDTYIIHLFCFFNLVFIFLFSMKAGICFFSPNNYQVTPESFIKPILSLGVSNTIHKFWNIYMYFLSFFFSSIFVSLSFLRIRTKTTWFIAVVAPRSDPVVQWGLDMFLDRSSISFYTVATFLITVALQ